MLAGASIWMTYFTGKYLYGLAMAGEGMKGKAKVWFIGFADSLSFSLSVYSVRVSGFIAGFIFKELIG